MGKNHPVDQGLLREIILKALKEQVEFNRDEANTNKRLTSSDKKKLRKEARRIEKEIDQLKNH